MENELEIDSFLFENNNKNYFKYENDNNLINNSELKTTKEKPKKKNNNINGNKKKKINYVFEIKIENEVKKLILKKGEDINLIVKNFSEKYNINENEKNKILKIIEERLKTLNSN